MANVPMSHKTDLMEKRPTNQLGLAVMTACGVLSVLGLVSSLPLALVAGMAASISRGWFEETTSYLLAFSPLLFLVAFVAAILFCYRRAGVVAFVTAAISFSLGAIGLLPFVFPRFFPI
ncbi:hypothetical protein ACFOMD_05100 [Sphingoaurantiacus capsulatus]|uniref:Uncharacterized protein n=1 Tax=Sphingoaurantiacus capsulatus TaxID=1771310 RepID=A0ABV7X8Z1_9SPHN